MPDVPIRRRSMADSLEYVAGRLEAAADGGTERTLRTVASQAVFSLRMLAAETEEPEPPKKGPLVLNTYTGQWVPIPDADITEAFNDPVGYGARAQDRFYGEWLAEHPEDARD